LFLVTSILTKLGWGVIGLINPEEFQHTFLDWLRTIQKLTEGGSDSDLWEAIAWIERRKQRPN
jgi:hypothetical protein